MADLTKAHGIETVSCNQCGDSSTTLKFKVPVREDQKGVYGQDVWDIVECTNCGLVYTNPRPDAAALDVFYEFVSDWDYQYIQDWFIANADLQRPTWNRYLDLVLAQQPTGKLLDVGCGAGTFLVEAKKAGYDVYGQDVAPYFIEYSQKEQGLPIYAGDLDDLDLPHNNFDVVTAFDVIEHHPDPSKLLKQMHDLAKPGGYILISTHDIGNFYAKLHGDKWRHLLPIGHLTYFTRDSLKAMMRKNNIEPIKEGGIHTVNNNRLIEIKNKIQQFGRVILLRSLILLTYKPLTQRFSALTNWEINLKGGVLTHKKLLTRVGTQIIMDDDMVILAKVTKTA